VPETLQRLQDLGHVYTEGGALWMRTTDFGDDKDRVLIKSDGELTYFASDTAYYLNKRARGFDHCIYLLGADHHGYVNRLRAMAACVGDDPDVTLDVMIGQLVKIVQGGPYREGAVALGMSRLYGRSMDTYQTASVGLYGAAFGMENAQVALTGRPFAAARIHRRAAIRSTAVALRRGIGSGSVEPLPSGGGY